MGNVNFKYEFPCGYRLEIRANALLLKVDVTEDHLLICPLHGKDCHGRKQ